MVTSKNIRLLTKNIEIAEGSELRVLPRVYGATSSSVSVIASPTDNASLAAPRNKALRDIVANSFFCRPHKVIR